jgi:lipoprotein-anchoring transpeptidase ErfK/SrfK
MPVRVKDDSITRSMMLLCLGTAGVLALVQSQSMAGRFERRAMEASLANSVSSQQSLNVMEASVGSEPQSQPISKPVASEAGKPSPDEASQAADSKDTRLVVKLGDRQVQVYRNNQLLESYPIAVAKPGWETPTGTFQVLDMEKTPTWVHPITGVAVPPGSDNPMGAAWIGFISNGEGEIGFHGTNQEELIGEAVSHGCLRMRNEDVQALYAQVTPGTPVIVQQ